MINVGDPTNACNGCNKRYVDVKTNNFFENWWYESNDWWFEYGLRSITYLKEPKTYENSNAVNVGFFIKKLSNSNANLQTIIDSKYEKYVSNRFNHSLSSTDQKNVFPYLMDNPSSEFSDEGDITGVQTTNKGFHKVKKKLPMRWSLILIQG